MKSESKKRIHVIINPASGKNEPILNVINSVFGEHEIDWTVSVTQKYGDATDYARQAVADGFDIVAAYGGDGTQHEVANGILGSDSLLGVLPGGTGNGFANEMGTPNKLQPALELLCTSENVRKVDVVQVGEGYFVQRLYVGIEPEEQTSREDKDKYGTFAYAINSYHQMRDSKQINFRITIDGELIEQSAMKVYVINAPMTGTGISVTGDLSSPEDGLVDVFVLDYKDLNTLAGAADRMLHFDTRRAKDLLWRGKEISIDVDPDQPVWTDGEYIGRTPVTMKVVPGALPVVVP